LTERVADEPGASSSVGRVALSIRKLRGPATLAVLCLIPAALWASALPLSARFTDAPTTLTSIAVVLALTGTASFAANLVLGGRFKLIDAYFAGLDRMYKVHQINGRIAFLLLVGHFAGIFASRAATSLEGAFGLLTPSAGLTVLLGVAALAAMTVTIVLTLYGRLNHEWFIYVQRTFGFIFLLAALHVFRTPGTKALSPALTYYLGALSLAGIIAFVRRSLASDALVQRRRYRVTAAKELDQSVMEVTMTPENGSMTFTPGQFVYVTFTSDAMSREFFPFSITSAGESEVVEFRPGAVRSQFHPFSITSGPRDKDLKIAAKAVGDYTRAMHYLEQGALATVEGPYGAFSYKNVPSAKQIWVAGGIGVTPFVSMARSLGGEDPGIDIDFYYGMEHGDEGYFLDELEDIARRHPSFKVIPYPRDELGFMTAEDIAKRSGDLKDKDILICGPPGMIDNLHAQFVARGVPERQIHFEKFGFVPRH